MSEHEEPLLLRWSRRKLEAGRVDATATATAPVPEPAAAPPAPVAAVPPAPPPAPGPTVRVEDLPDVESLNFESDFTAFLQAGVPEELRLRALRKLWTSDPVLANLDGLNDYDALTMKFLVEDVDALELASRAVQNHTGAHSGADGFREQARALAERRAEPPAASTPAPEDASPPDDDPAGA